MLGDWELWACANHVLQAHGDKAPLHVAEQIGALALAGDEAGIRTWQAIAERIVQLSSNAPDRPLQEPSSARLPSSSDRRQIARK